MTITTVNPATGDQLGSYANDSDADVERKLTAARTAWREWRRIEVTDRVMTCAPLAEALRTDREHLAALVTAEMGKPIRQSLAEVDKTATGIEWFLGAAPDVLVSEVRNPDEPATVVEYRSYGPILGIMPWNFPYWQVLRSVVPALLAGNAYLLKPSPVTVGAGIAVRDLIRRCDLPDGLFDVLLIDERTTGQVIDDDRVAAVTLTGSVRAGRAVAKRAGAALKPTVLELGGSDPFVVLADVKDLDEAAAVAVAARMQNGGQSCLAAKRFIVERAVADEFQQAVDGRIAALTVGDPMDPSTDVGPLASHRARADLHNQVERSIAAGATRRLGAEPMNQSGAWYQPGALTDVEPHHPAGCEELFGPVATTQIAADVDDALRRATATAFGLGASVWTQDPASARAVVDDLRAGTIAVNQSTRSDPRFPFGGFGLSGHGRELSTEGLREFTAPVTIYGHPGARVASNSRVTSEVRSKKRAEQ